MHFMTGMRQETVRANGIKVNLWAGGKGLPVLLLHGYPQTAQMWHRIAPVLCGEYAVVCPDLRGYGDTASLPAATTRRPWRATCARLWARWGTSAMRWSATTAAAGWRTARHWTIPTR